MPVVHLVRHFHERRHEPVKVAGELVFDALGPARLPLEYPGRLKEGVIRGGGRGGWKRGGGGGGGDHYLPDHRHVFASLASFLLGFDELWRKQITQPDG